MKVRLFSTLMAWAKGGTAAAPVESYHHAPTVAPGVIPAAEKLALDESYANHYSYISDILCCLDRFPGYPTLVQYTQQAEYRMLSEKTAMAMTRKWIKIRSKGDKDNGPLIKAIEDEMERLKVRELFGEAAKLDGFMGRAQLFIDLGEQQDENILMMPLFKSAAVLKDKLQKFKIVEAMYTYPDRYDAANPLSDAYFNPSLWYVMGKRVHTTRLLTFIGRPVPDMLKPSYNFGGMSMSQLARPYVDNWIKTRNSVGKLLRNFSTSVLATNMGDVLADGDGEGLLGRAQLFTGLRDNQDLMVLDKDAEEFIQVNTPLGTVDKLQAQAQEHMASVASMPLTILLGITPAGLNASSEGEIRTFYDHILDMQNVMFRPNLVQVLELIQLSKFGVIDPDITFDFVPLWDQDEGELATNRKADAETADIYVAMGAVSPEEVRERVAGDPHSGFNGIDVSAMPERPEEPEATPPGDE
jgi:hypothetical protein